MKKRFLPPSYFNTSVILMIALHLIFPLKSIITSPYNYFGLLLLLLGFLMNIWASEYFKKVQTAIKPFQKSSYLVTEGLFKYSRHPMYLGMVVALLGLFLFLGSITPIIIIPMFIYSIKKKFIQVEEKTLEEKFGEQYLTYKKKVRCWI